MAHAGSVISDGSLSTHAPLAGTPSMGGAEVRWASDLLASPGATAQGGGGGGGKGEGGGLGKGDVSYAGSVASSVAAPPPTAEGPPPMGGASDGSHPSSTVTRRRDGPPSVLPGPSWRCLQGTYLCVVDMAGILRAPINRSTDPLPSHHALITSDLEGDYSRLQAMPPEREDAESTPWIRFVDVWHYARNLFCPRDAGKALR